MSGYFSEQGYRGLRVWRHDRWYRVQQKRPPIRGRDGVLQRVWESLPKDGSIFLASTPEEALLFLREIRSHVC